MMQRVPQRNNEHGDCGLACVAMVTGLPYKLVHDKAVELGLRSADGTYFTCHNQLQKLLGSFGRGSTLKKFVSMREVKPVSIVAVNPREGGWRWHWVVIASSRNGLALFDPKPGKPARLHRFNGYKGIGKYVHAA